MYSSGGNATANSLLLPTENYVVLSARLGSPGYIRRNPTEQQILRSDYIITREALVHKSIYGHLTRMITMDEIINANALKMPQNTKGQC